MFRRELAQPAKPGHGCKAFRLADALNRPADVLLKIGKQRGIGGIEAFAQNVTGGFERGGCHAFKVLGDVVEWLFNPLVVGRERHGLRRIQARVHKHDLFKVVLRGAVVAVRPVAIGCLGFYELLVDLGLSTPHMLGEIDKRG